MLVVELSQTVRAPRDAVWKAVSALHRQREYVAYEITRFEPTNECDLGPDFCWRETGVLLGKRHECDCHVFGWEPNEWVCFGSKDLFHVSYAIEADGDATRIEYRVELPQTPELRRPAFTALCRQSLGNLKALIEGPQSDAAADPRVDR